MAEESVSTSPLTVKQIILRFAALLGIACAVGFGGHFTVLNGSQALACAVFIGIIMGTLFFWTFRLSVAFIGLAVLVISGSMDIPCMVRSSSLEVILFLVGMMVIVGALKDLGFFTWVVQLIVSIPKLTARRFVAVTSIVSALLACIVDEVTSIIFISVLIFQVCRRLKISPAPFILIAVLCTNIGSSGTMLGNPVGIYIGNKGGLSFGDFMLWAFPLMLLTLFAMVGLMILIFHRQFDEFDRRLQERLAQGLSLAPAIRVPYRAGVILILCTTVAIASHHQVETMLRLSQNSMLIVAPLICAGVVMILRPDRARHYIDAEVDWWTLLFFMLLFSVAGTLEHTGVDRVMARGFSKVCGTTPATLVPFIFGASAVGSAFVDNVIFVAAFCPVIEELSVSVKALPLWWALLFGACFGGNITMIGSTANIVALGMLEKRTGEHITFFRWFKIGFVATLLSAAVAVGGVLLLTPRMPDRCSESTVNRLAGRTFDDKLIRVSGELVRDGSGSAWRLIGSRNQIAVEVPAGLAPKAANFNGKECRVRGRLTSRGAKQLPLMKAEAILPPEEK